MRGFREIREIKEVKEDKDKKKPLFIEDCHFTDSMIQDLKEMIDDIYKNEGPE